MDVQSVLAPQIHHRLSGSSGTVHSVFNPWSSSNATVQLNPAAIAVETDVSTNVLNVVPHILILLHVNGCL